METTVYVFKFRKIFFREDAFFTTRSRPIIGKRIIATIFTAAAMPSVIPERYKYFLSFCFDQ